MAKTIARLLFLTSVVATFVVAAAVLAPWLDAVRDVFGPNRLVVPFRLEHPMDAQVFYDLGQGIRAEDVATTTVPGTTRLQAVSFALPRQNIRELRFDPMTTAGRFWVGAPRLVTASGRLVAQLSLSAITPRNQIQSLMLEGDHWLGDTAPNANDPQLTFGLDTPLRAGSPRIPWLGSLVFLACGSCGLVLMRVPANRSLILGVRASLARLPPPPVAPQLALLLGALFATVVELKLVWPLRHTLDLPLWDEVNYAASGQDWLHGLVAKIPFHNSPGYLALYAELARFAAIPAAIFAQHYLLKVGTMVLLYFVLARWCRSWSAALSLALCWGLAEYNLEAALLVYHAALFWFLAALAVVDFCPLLGLGLVLLATCTRQEYEFAAGLLFAWLGFRAWRTPRPFRHWLYTGTKQTGRWIATGATGLVFAVVLDLLQHATFGHEDARAWFAFQQHYALRAVQKGTITGLNPLLDYPQVMQKDFPGAKSLLTAYHANPSAFREHVLDNVVSVPREILQTLTPHAGAGLVAGLLVLGAFCSSTGGRPRSPPDGGAWTNSRILALSAVVVVAPGLVILVTSRYLLPLVPLVFAIAGEACRWIRGRIKMPIAVSTSVAIVAVTVAGSVALAAAAVFVPGSRPRPVADSLTVIRPLVPTGGGHILLGVSATSYAHYLGDRNWLGVEALAEATGVVGASASASALVARHRADAVIVTPEWTSSPRFRADEIKQLLAPPQWREIEIPAGQLYLRQAEK